MMNLKAGKIIDVILRALLLVALFCFILRIRGAYSSKVYYPKEIGNAYRDEDFDVSLLRLNTMGALSAYCDSLARALPNRTYPEIASEVLRKRFYHGYSYYTTEENPVALLFAPFLKNGGVAAIVIPDDILKYPNAACSQQSIVGMELFKRKGYEVRKVLMFDTVSQAGHFAYEVNYEKGWHFFDTNQEPDQTIFAKYKRPSIAFLAKNPEIVKQAYKSKSDPAMFERLVLSYKVGPVDEFPAPRAYLYQKVTSFLTYFGWTIIWAIIAYRGYRRRKIKNNRVQATAIQENEASFSPELIASLPQEKTLS